tara:strand:+ start:3271 stop:3921 length:651 start_codon:yes stop_codon:yes gene_type:complete
MNKSPSDVALVLGVETLWLIIPIVYGINLTIKSKKRNYYILILIIATILANNLSVLHWRYNSRKESLLHKIDVLFARILFITLLLLGINKKQHWLYSISLLYAFFVSLFYFISEYFFKIKKYDLAMFNHLTFRFIGFWWVHTTFAAYNNIKFYDYFNKKYHFLWSFSYYLHCLLLTIYSKNNKINKKIYDLCCFTLILWIIICGFFIKNITGRKYQ